MTQDLPKRTVKVINGRRIVFDEDGKPSCNSLLDFQLATKGTGIIDKETSSSNSSRNKESTGTSTNPNDIGIGIMAGAIAGAMAKEKPRAYGDCPPDVQQLGRSTWTFLHTMAGKYPVKASETEQMEMKTFLDVFSKVYPCWWCAEDLRKWMSQGHEPKVGGREELGNWLCEAHNQVNKKLGKPSFDCKEWKARWKDGWDDGRCD